MQPLCAGRAAKALQQSRRGAAPRPWACCRGSERIDTEGAWAEFLRHEGITDSSELVNVRQALWAIELPEDLPAEAQRLAKAVLTGGTARYKECQVEGRRLLAPCRGAR